MYKIGKRAKNLVIDNRVGFVLIGFLIVTSNKICHKHRNVHYL